MPDDPYLAAKQLAEITRAANALERIADALDDLAPLLLAGKALQATGDVPPLNIDTEAVFTASQNLGTETK
jgi:hypothetical protein